MQALVSYGRRMKVTLLLYAAVALLLWTMPLVRVLHAESSAAVAAVAFGAAGIDAAWRFRQQAPVTRVWRDHTVALFVPLALLSATALVVPNCGYLLGLLFFALFPGVTVLFAVMLAYLLVQARVRRPRLTLIAVGVLVAVGGVVYDVGFHPQFYTYNHVFGGVLGPIYDDELAVRPGLFFFRAVTVVWASLFFFLGERLRVRRAAQGRGVGTPFWSPGGWGRVLGAVAVLGAAYLSSAPLGLNTPAWYLQDALGAVHRTDHFDIYYDPRSVTPANLRWIAARHEYAYAREAALLHTDVPGRIASYLYPNASTKARLTGARRTSVAPVWLARPQVHVLLPQLEAVFPHELAHVFSRSFGMPVLHASVMVGLVEGLAVALEPPDGRPTPHEQVAAASVLGTGLAGARDLAATVSARLTPLGFWTGRVAVSYTSMGSFVRYLLDRYGAEAFKEAYAWGTFEQAYGKGSAELADEWMRYVLQQPSMDAGTEALVTRRFAVPSLFEVRCPHYVAPYRRHYRSAAQALLRGDTTAARRDVDASLAMQPRYQPALDLWARLMLADGAPAAVLARFDTLAIDTLSAALYVARGDALTLLDRPGAALAAYGRARRHLPPYARSARAAVALRQGLAGRPAVVALVTSGAGPAQRAARLAAEAGSIPQVARAILLDDAGLSADAAAVYAGLGSLDDPAWSPAERRLMARARLAWWSDAAMHAGSYQVARRLAKQAATAAMAAGDLDGARSMHEKERMIEWLQARRNNGASR